MSVEQAFNQASQTYDGWVRKALPGFEDLFAHAQNALVFPPDSPLTVLDLGAGTGLFSSYILARYPRARFTLMDLAENMLAVARVRFQDHPAQFTYTVADIRAIHYPAEFDLAISSLVIHHLEHPEKQALFRRIYHALKPGGVILNVDQIHAPDESLCTHYWAEWLRHVRAQDASEEQIQQSIARRQAYDHDAPLEDQLAWLREAGFSSVDILYKNLFIGLFYARKAEPGLSPLKMDELSAGINH